jgi:hypothetical protein
VVTTVAVNGPGMCLRNSLQIVSEMWASDSGVAEDWSRLGWAGSSWRFIGTMVRWSIRITCTVTALHPRRLEFSNSLCFCVKRMTKSIYLMCCR